MGYLIIYGDEFIHQSFNSEENRRIVNVRVSYKGRREGGFVTEQTAKHSPVLRWGWDD